MIINMSGGGGKPYAVIGVTYPAGSTCVCSNGSKTLKAKDTSGTALFSIPSAGEWTVTATSADGAKTKSVTVSITTKGQAETVELTYELVLFDGATGAIADGYTLTNGAVKKDNTYGSYIPFDVGTSTPSKSVHISPMIDVSTYTKLTMKVCLTSSAYNSVSYGAIGLYKTLPSYSAINPIAGVTIGYGQSSEPWGLANAVEREIDISALTGEYYFAGFTNGWTPSALSVKFS